jgi:4'-phosphopantetheinyl transferase
MSDEAAVPIDAGLGWDELALQPVRGGSEEVHVWAFDLDRSPSELTLLARCLSTSDVARASTFLAKREQDHFIVGRGVLRSLLALISGSPVADLVIETAPDSTKPQLAAPSPYVFNLSHSAGLGLVAVSRTSAVRAIGVDIERIRPNPAIDALTQRLFSPSERHEISGITGGSERIGAFYACWCRKEAVMKGIGPGVDLPMADFDVSVCSSNPHPVTGRGDAQIAVSGWLVEPLHVTEGFAAALAILR